MSSLTEIVFPITLPFGSNDHPMNACSAASGGYEILEMSTSPAFSTFNTLKFVVPFTSLNVI